MVPVPVGRSPVLLLTSPLLTARTRAGVRPAPLQAPLSALTPPELFPPAEQIALLTALALAGRPPAAERRVRLLPGPRGRLGRLAASLRRLCAACG